MKITVNIERADNGGYIAAIEPGVIAGIYGDTEAEAAMTAVYNAFQREADAHRNGWKHIG